MLQDERRKEGKREKSRQGEDTKDGNGMHVHIYG